MKIIKPNVELMKHNTDAYSFIERAGRVCYKSEDQIKDGSAEKFVINLAKNQHYAMLEHEYLYFHFLNYNDVIQFISGFLVPDSHSYGLAKYLNISEKYISGSIRAWLEFFDEINKLSEKYVLGMGIYKQMYCELHNTYPNIFTNKEMFKFSKEDKETLPLEKITLVSREYFIKQKEPSYVYYNLLPHTIKFTIDRGCCYDDQTQVLTKDGWKYFKDVTMKDIFVSLDDNNNLTEVRPKQIIVQDYKGNLDYWKSTQIDCMVTPNHNMWLFDYQKRSQKTKIWKFIKSSEANNSSYGFNKSANPINYIGYKEYTIPSVVINKGFYQKKYPELTFDANLFFELIGWWITDGSISPGKNGSGNRLCITQIKEKGVNRIQELLDNLKIPYNRYRNDFRIKCPQLYRWIKNTFIHNNDNKKTYYITIPRWMLNELSTENLQALLKGIIGGNGSKHTKGWGYVISMGSKQLAYDLVELALKIGHAANVYIKPAGKYKFPNSDKLIQCKEYYIVSLIKTTKTWFDTKKRTKQYYDGKVYCVELEKYHRLYVMRNGKPCWCGNSHELVRHRPASFAQSSTRYCDYANGKFGSELTFIKPCFWESTGEGSNWFEVCKHAEEAYLDMRENGVKPEEARSILPNSLMTELIVTATEEEWQHIINLRYHGTTGRPHPQMLEIMEMAYPILVEESEGRIK